MRRMVLALLTGALVLLLAARAVDRPGQAVPAAAWDGGAYNVLQLDRPPAEGTAGSSLTAELDSYYLTRQPTAKTGRTGSLAGRDLVVLLAEDWRPDESQAEGRWDKSARFPDFYAPDWYQGADGREFALLAGVIPTAVGGDTALAWAGEQGTSLPFALGNALAAEGYTCRLYPAREGLEASYAALGFETGPLCGADGETITAALEDLAAHRPFAACFILSGTDGSGALAALWRQLERAGLAEETAVCLVAGADASQRGTLALWGEGLAGTETDRVCSELDVTPTLLDLVGAAYDARFLSGRDLFAGGPDVPVSLWGSAYSDWVTEAGSYSAAQARFLPADGAGWTEQQTERYVRQMCREVYERYVCAQRAMQSNYFRTVLSREDRMA